LRPGALIDQSGNVIFVLEARDGVVRLMFHERAGNAAALLGIEQWQSPAMQEIMHEGGDEHGLAGARKSGHAKPQGWRDERGCVSRQCIERNQRVIGQCRQAGQICPVRAFRQPDIECRPCS
jgi:hypothetical protein